MIIRSSDKTGSTMSGKVSTRTQKSRLSPAGFVSIPQWQLVLNTTFTMDMPMGLLIFGSVTNTDHLDLESQSLAR